MSASSTRRVRTSRRGLVLWIVGLGTLAVIVIAGARGQANAANPPIDGIPCDRGEQLAFHIHAHLAIYAAGQPLGIPYGIGIGTPWLIQQSSEGPVVASGTCFRWLHTHTDDGIIHIESPVQRTFSLGDFFAIWGVPLSGNHVAGAEGPVVAYVNGERWSGDPREITLLAHELIQLDVGDDTPPQPFTFPAGL